MVSPVLYHVCFAIQKDCKDDPCYDASGKYRRRENLSVISKYALHAELKKPLWDFEFCGFLGHVCTVE